MMVVYALCDSRKPGWWAYKNGYGFDYKPFYVGQTNGLARRVLEHFNNVDKPMSRRLRDSVQEAGLVVEVLASSNDRRELCAIEKDAIGSIGRRDLGLGPLLNRASGGQAPARVKPNSRPGWEVTKHLHPAVKEYYRLLGPKGRSERGQKLADKRKENGSEPARGLSISKTKSEQARAAYLSKLRPYDHFRILKSRYVLTHRCGVLVPHVCETHGKYLISRDHVVANIRNHDEPCRFCVRGL